MTRQRKHPRGLTDRFLASALLKVIGLDLLLGAAVAAIGITVYRLSPDLVYGYAGVLILAAWWVIGESRAKAKDPKAS